MPHTVSATEAKNRFGVISGWAEAGEDVLIENHGRPAVALISYGEYERLLAWRERERRQELVRQVEALRTQVAARNPDITSEEQAMEIANAALHEAYMMRVAEERAKYGEQ